MLISKIISGGQTGVDMGTILAAIACERDWGGEIPKGRKYERGSIPHSFFNFTESPSPDYPVRTRKNIKDSDATLIIVNNGHIGRGSGLTIKVCQELEKPHKLLSFESGCYMMGLTTEIFEWLQQFHKPIILNVAGSRESSSPGIEKDTKVLIMNLLTADYQIRARS